MLAIDGQTAEPNWLNLGEVVTWAKKCCLKIQEEKNYNFILNFVFHSTGTAGHLS